MRSLRIEIAIGAVIGIWLVVYGLHRWAEAAKPTPEKLVAFVAAHPVDGRSGAQRDKVIDSVAQQLNQLEYEERRDLRVNKKLEAFFKSLNSAEQDRFLDLTVPAGYKQMMEAFNKMAPQKRKQMVEKAMVQIQAQTIDEAKPQMDDPHVRKMIDQGFQSFYSDASAETKMDLAPLIEQIQKNLQGLGQ
jgi:basic membrane lipoprotein Med (substrate-binding protein (PBP1-ABC) superfamily)